MYLVDAGQGTASARQIAGAYDLPLPLLSKILKSMHCKGLLQSTRGVKGGYRIAVNLHDVTLDRLVRVLRGTAATPNADADERPVGPPLVALHEKLERFLRDVRLSDLIIPGRRIDVPLGMVGIRRKCSTELAKI
jgi:DNA-binding IscR family transcriptional regulator